MSILGELDRAGLLHTDVPVIHAKTMKDALDAWDIKRNVNNDVLQMYKAAPGGVPTQVAFSQSQYWPEIDDDRQKGIIRDYDHAFTKEGGLAVLFGNIAERGCIVKTAGVDESIFKFSGPAHVVDSQEAAVAEVLGGEVKEGNVVIIRYEGPQGGPGMQEMLYPTSYIKSMGLGKKCALLTDGRFSGGTSGLSIGHCSPEAAEGGAIGLVENGDIIEIDIPNRTINMRISDKELSERREKMEKLGENAWKPNRKRETPLSLRAWAHFATSADKGAVRDYKKL